MSRLPSPRLTALGLLALVLAGTAAPAADFDGPYGPRLDRGQARLDRGLARLDRGPVFAEDDGYRPPPPRVPRFSAGPDGPPCRVFVKRRFDADGEPVIRRVRVCDEPDDLGPPRRPRFDSPPHDFPDGRDGRWGGPRW